MARKPAPEDRFANSLNPKDSDTNSKYPGDEPLFAVQPDPDLRGSAMVRAFSWYGRFYNRKDSKPILVGYLDYKGRTADAKLMRRVDEKEFLHSLVWLARMSIRGLVLTEHEEGIVQREISRLLKTVHKPEVDEVEEKPKESNRPNIQEIMREKAILAAGELEGILDEFVLTGSKANFTAKIVDELAKHNVMSQHVSIITDIWKQKLEEFNEVLKGSEPQLVEGFSNFSKTQIKNTIKFIESVIGDLNSYINVKKATKAPRKRKAVPVEKIVARLKHLKSFKDATLKLDLVGLHPTKLHGAAEAWVYDTKRRKMHHLIADEYSKTLTVKGNTVLGFDTNTSEVKTLRKPAEQIKALMGSKPAARKFFKEIRAVSTTPKGRFNADMIILKAF